MARNARRNMSEGGHLARRTGMEVDGAISYMNLSNLTLEYNYYQEG